MSDLPGLTRYQGHRAKVRHPDLDEPHPRVLCGGLSGRCPEVVGYVREGTARIGFILPTGYTDRGTPGVHHPGRYLRDRIARGERPAHDSARFGDGPAGVAYDRETWLRTNPRMVAMPCIVICPKGHENDVDAPFLSG